MSLLKDLPCEACQADAQPVSASEQEALLQQLPQWSVVQTAGMPQLRRNYAFNNFAEALAFTNQVGALAEAVNHHPEIITEWGKVTVTWWTHVIRGLHRNDFILAAKTDALF